MNINELKSGMLVLKDTGETGLVINDTIMYQESLVIIDPENENDLLAIHIIKVSVPQSGDNLINKSWEGVEIHWEYDKSFIYEEIDKLLLNLKNSNQSQVNSHYSYDDLLAEDGIMITKLQQLFKLLKTMDNEENI